MPRHLTHDNEAARIYLARAAAGKEARGVPTDLNCPAIEITWWDAYAYAKWLGAQTGTGAGPSDRRRMDRRRRR
jgi:formylglycine-generating enzyme required for sulfatase activity